MQRTAVLRMLIRQGLCRSSSRRLLHGIVQGCGKTCTTAGLAKVLAVHGLVASIALGAKRCARIWVCALGAVLTAQTINAARTQPEGDAGTAFLKGISGGNEASLSVGLVQVMDIFDKCGPQVSATCSRCMTHFNFASECLHSCMHICAGWRLPESHPCNRHRLEGTCAVLAPEHCEHATGFSRRFQS